VAYTEPLHPVTKQPLTELERYLWRLRMVAQEALYMHRGLHKTGDAAKALNEELLFLLTSYGLIIVCKFLEIWDRFGALGKDNERIRDVRRAIQPFVDRIRTWKGLDTFRNTALAHPYLTKDGKLIGPWQLLIEGRAPTYHAEILLLVQCVRFAVLGVLTAFQTEYEALKPILTSPPPQPSPGQGVEKGTQIPEVLRPIAKEVDQRLKPLGVVVGGPVAKEFIDIIVRVDLLLS